LNSMVEWSLKWQLRFNASKCKVMQIGKGKDMYKYSMEVQSQKIDLETTEEEKDLGVWIDSDLKFSKHVGYAVAKANQMVGLVRRSFTYLDCRSVKMLYTAIIRPHLEYGNIVWHPRYKKDIELLENVQRRATKLVPELKNMDYEQRLRRLELPTLVYRRMRGDAIEVYKYLHGTYMVDAAKLLPLAQVRSGVNTRGHSMKLQKRQCATKARQNFFSYRVVNMWNSLSEEVVNAPSVNSFKNRLDRHWRHLMYSFDVGT